MKGILRDLCCVGLLVSFASITSAATITMSGTISDSMCGASHAKMIAEHPAMKDDKTCTQGCVKSGAKYVFVSEGKVYEIANQGMAALSKDAGEAVTVTGDMNGNAITVSKISMKK